MAVSKRSFYADDFAFEDHFCGRGAANFSDDAFGYGVDAVGLAGLSDCATDAPGEGDCVFDCPAFGLCSCYRAFCATDVGSWVGEISNVFERVGGR